jgi:hypothetical protein
MDLHRERLESFHQAPVIPECMDQASCLQRSHRERKHQTAKRSAPSAAAGVLDSFCVDQYICEPDQQFEPLFFLKLSDYINQVARVAIKHEVMIVCDFEFQQVLTLHCESEPCWTVEFNALSVFPRDFKLWNDE